ncbi:MAG: PEP-CTERM sorting domain-containing protein, partial [Sedimentisphaerales bacterium]|nr:PEP-CTERM sorting domain-containing protein [Sedimentisphaerales bacterium]
VYFYQQSGSRGTSFEQGNTGFSTSYTYTDSQPSGLDPAGYYAIGIDPSYYHLGTVSYGDHTSGYGNMMIVNGHTSPDVTLWQQTVSISPNTEYEFSLWLSNWDGDPPAQLEYFINDISIGSSSTPETTSEWIRFSKLWQSGLNTMATIRIVDIETAWGGNDFAIDDITLVPEPGTVVLLGLGGLGLIHRKR